MDANQEPERINFEAPFRSPEQAVAVAYALEAEAIVECSHFFADLRGSTVPLPGREPLSAYDRHAQAAMTLAFIGNALDPLELLAIRARRTVPQAGMLATRKEGDAILLYEIFVHGHEPREAPADFRDYALDAIRGWARAKRQHKEWWWADRFEADVGRLRRWRWGSRKHRERGFLSRIEGVYQNAIGKLADPMYEAGLTQE